MAGGLTKRTVDAATYEGSGRHVVWDSEITGFGLRVYPSGRKAFVLSYRMHSRKRLLTLGTYGVLTVQEGREAARKALGKVAEGDDPLESRKDSRRLRVTLEEDADEWLGKVKRRSARIDEMRLDKHILPALGSKALESITEGDCERLHVKVTERGPVEANRTLELLRLMLNAASEDGLIDSNPAARDWRSKRGNMERSRTRYLKRDEFEAFTKAVQEEQNPYVRAVIWLLLLTGARSHSELLQLRWNDIDWDAGLVTFRRSKTGDELPLPLSEPAWRILSELPRAMGNPYVFPGRDPGTHRKTIRWSFERICEKAGLTGDRKVTLHDLRRTAGSLMAQSGIPLSHIKSVLGHKSEAVTAIYARLGEDETKQAVDVLGSLIAEIQGEPAESSDQDALDEEAAELRARLAEIENARVLKTPSVGS